MAQAKRKERNLSAVDEEPEKSEQGEAEEEFVRWKRPEALSRRGWMILGGIVLLMNIPLIHMVLKSAPEVAVRLPYFDDFSSKETIKKNYFTTGGLWRIVDGQLFSPGVKNNPLWLKAQLPRDVAVDFDVRCDSPEGDIRVEIFGNGVDHLSGYELVHGAYNNSKSIIGRLDDRLVDENGRSLTLTDLQNRARQAASDLHLPSSGLKETGVFRPRTHVVAEANLFPVTPRKTYHWRIERRGGVLRWAIDGQPFMQLDDPYPLEGSGHDRFGPSSSESDVYFDNLKVEPLDASAAAAPFETPNPTAVAAAAPAAAPVAGSAFEDRFDRAELGPSWLATDPSAVRLESGSILVQNAHNHPVWLSPPIPENADIEFDSWTDSPVGDMKVEVWGDGHSFHTGPLNGAYTSTGYVFVFGGWNNSLSAIAKQHEHGADRAVRDDTKVEPGRHYHWKIMRKGGEFAWMLDGKPFLAVKDPAPLTGADHQHFAFGDWESPVHFANLIIRPLPGS